MIPKIIHYCWFGSAEKDKNVIKYIETWKKKCPDYQIIEWNESNTDLNSCLFAKQAHEAKKWAFCADYIRLKALYEIGGVYMDTDVEAVKSFDDLLCNKAFFGFESEKIIATAVIGAEKNHPFIKKLLDEYNDRSFINPDGSYNMETNTNYITSTLLKNGLILNNKEQNVCDIEIYPIDWFCPYDDTTGIKQKSQNTVAIHWFSKSWIDKKIVLRSKITRVFHRIFGVNCFSFLKRK